MSYRDSKRTANKIKNEVKNMLVSLNRLKAMLPPEDENTPPEMTRIAFWGSLAKGVYDFGLNDDGRPDAGLAGLRVE